MAGIYDFQCNSVTMKAIKTQTMDFVSPLFGLPISHLHDGIILRPRPECFVKMLSCSNLSSFVGIESQVIYEMFHILNCGF